MATSILLVFVALSGSWLYGAKPKTPKLPAELKLSDSPGKATYNAQSGDFPDPRFAVCVPKTYDADKPIPLVVSAHGAGGNGPAELDEWEPLAEKYGFLVACPCYASSTGPNTNEQKMAKLRIDAMMLDEVVRRVFGSFNVDRKHVMHTGFSGGGNATWYLGMSHPEVFTMLCFRSANYHGPVFFTTHNLAPWRNRSIYMFWGEKDHDLIIKTVPGHVAEGPSGLLFLQQLGCQNIKNEILPDGGHASRADLAAKWFSEEVAKKPEKTTKKRKPKPVAAE